MELNSTTSSCVVLEFGQLDDSLALISPAESPGPSLASYLGPRTDKGSPESSVVLMEFNELESSGRHSAESSILFLDFDDASVSDMVNPSCVSTSTPLKATSQASAKSAAVKQLSFAPGEENLLEELCSLPSFGSSQ